MKTTIKSFKDLELLSDYAAAYVSRTAAREVLKKGYFTLVVSGGSAPVMLYKKLTEKKYKMPWDKTYIFWQDERYVGKKNKFSNFRLVKETMLDDITIPDKNIFGVPVQVKPAKKCALKYSVLIKDFFKEHKQHGFDLIIAGVGPDGHTASLFPGDDKALNEKNRMVIAVKAPKWAEACSRITMTLPLINDCKDMLFVISGEGKDEAMKKILSGDRNYPTARVRAKKDIVWLIDRSSVKLKI